MLRLAFALALLLSGAPALGRPVACVTSVNGVTLDMMYDTTDGMVRENRSYRERLFGRYGRITCPGYVTLRAMTPDLTDEERALFCLQYDRELRTYTGFVVGERDAYVGCRRPSKSFCEHVDATRQTAARIAGVGSQLVGAGADAAVGGIDAVSHGSGAMILTGSGQNLYGTLQTVGAGAISFLTAPETLAAAAVTVVAVGGAVYLCSE